MKRLLSLIAVLLLLIWAIWGVDAMAEQKSESVNPLQTESVGWCATVGL